MLKHFWLQTLLIKSLWPGRKRGLLKMASIRKGLKLTMTYSRLRTGDIYISYEPPDLIVRVVYEKKPSGMVKMKSVATIRL